MDKLLKFLNGLHPDARTAFATACGTSVGYLRKAVSSGQLLNAATCVAVERESNGEVVRKDLRPDDWRDIWPELAPSCAATAATTVTPLNHAGEAA